mmetsp:Transcript_32672/g.101043  ORF Transcript_32672/g.101043 Transcript_32672/m.101043 type:complete len:435 (-) Transcript_32672:109-1413(-)
MLRQRAHTDQLPAAPAAKRDRRLRRSGDGDRKLRARGGDRRLPPPRRRVHQTNAAAAALVPSYGLRVLPIAHGASVHPSRGGRHVGRIPRRLHRGSERHFSAVPSCRLHRHRLHTRVSVLSAVRRLQLLRNLRGVARGDTEAAAAATAVPGHAGAPGNVGADRPAAVVPPAAVVLLLGVHAPAPVFQHHRHGRLVHRDPRTRGPRGNARRVHGANGGHRAAARRVARDVAVVQASQLSRRVAHRGRHGRGAGDDRRRVRHVRRGQLHQHASVGVPRNAPVEHDGVIRGVCCGTGLLRQIEGACVVIRTGRREDRRAGQAAPQTPAAQRRAGGRRERGATAASPWTERGRRQRSQPGAGARLHQITPRRRQRAGRAHGAWRGESAAGLGSAKRFRVPKNRCGFMHLVRLGERLDIRCCECGERRRCRRWRRPSVR